MLDRMGCRKTRSAQKQHAQVHRPIVLIITYRTRM